VLPQYGIVSATEFPTASLKTRAIFVREEMRPLSRDLAQNLAKHEALWYP
jgi:hypothetical protein